MVTPPISKLADRIDLLITGLAVGNLGWVTWHLGGYLTGPMGTAFPVLMMTLALVVLRWLVVEPTGMLRMWWLPVQEQLDALRIKWSQDGDKWPSLVHQMRTRVGLNAGSCMIGNMGRRTRFNYTMMGDNVNLAARMESGAKSWGAFNMVSESTRVACEKFGNESTVFRPLGRIVVKGRPQPVPIHEVVGFRDKLADQTFECLDLFGKGMTHYYDRNWEAAAQAFDRSSELESLLPGAAPGVKNSPSMVYQQIIRDSAAKPPPPGWDGVYIMTEK